MRLLLVEDDPVLGPQLERSLEQTGYAVDVCTGGVEAEAQGDIEAYDLVLLDLGLPKRPGLDVLRHWRAAPFSRSEPASSARPRPQVTLPAGVGGGTFYLLVIALTAVIA